MEVETEVSVDADAEVVVHNEDLRVVLALRPCGHRRCNVSDTSDTIIIYIRCRQKLVTIIMER